MILFKLQPSKIPINTGTDVLLQTSNSGHAGAYTNIRFKIRFPRGLYVVQGNTDINIRFLDIGQIFEKKFRLRTKSKGEFRILIDNISLRTSSGFSQRNPPTELIIFSTSPPETPCVKTTKKTNHCKTNNFFGAKKMTRKTKILFLGATPTKEARINLTKEFQKIEDSLRMSKGRGMLDLKQRWAVTHDSLFQSLIDENPDIIHFSGHGSREGIYLENEFGDEAKTVSLIGLSDLLSNFEEIKCVLLNSCYSYEQAKLLKRHIPNVIGIRSTIPDECAIAFSTGFYKAIGAGESFSRACKLARSRILMEYDAISEESIPILAS